MGGNSNTPTQRLGARVPNSTARKRPPRSALQGRLCRVVTLEPEVHGPALFAANSEDLEGRMWTYLAHGPFESYEEYFFRDD
jgi:hypothetical protein